MFVEKWLKYETGYIYVTRKSKKTRARHFKTSNK